ncbi:FHA domain-containing protein FhaB/FipA [Nostocoides vanveenii]|jgi:pSer/pThr/pTyr-binding forkhead associated (FHA) protein|uniref:FHA domain-containing protein n=1 Tax=Nostocoides vanveenii TaxID=330835 RepID=A0ABN2KT26_9MICO
MSELTLTILKLGLLVLLWLFVFSLATVLRGDLYGTRVVNRVTTRRSGAAVAAGSPEPAPRGRRRNGAPNLVVTSGPLAGTRIPMGENDILIGRNPECHLVLDDDFASGRHARIFPAEGGWGVEDLSSTNGTFVNNHRIDEAVAFEAGSQIRIGRTIIELQK